MLLPAGTRLGPYEIVSALGVGSMGEVYRATDTKLKRQVAIKILPPDVASVETTLKYDGYLKQEQARAERARREERRRIPFDFPFGRVPGLSREVVHRLSQVRPETLGQASRIPGMTPAAVAVLGVFLGRMSANS